MDGEVRLARGVEPDGDYPGGVIFQLADETRSEAHSFHLFQDASPPSVIAYSADEGYRVPQYLGVRAKIKRSPTQMFSVPKYVP
jgi:hypothetical protein